MLHIGEFNTPPDQHNELQRQAIQRSNESIQRLLQADIIVISFTVWNFSISSVLKAWIDQISRSGLTFRYSEQAMANALSSIVV